MSEWAASYKRGNDLVDSVQLMVEYGNGQSFVARRTLIAALPEMRKLYECPDSRTDLQFLVPKEFQSALFKKEANVKRFYLEYAEIDKKDKRENQRC